MNIDKRHIHELPYEWAWELADNIVCDCPKYAYMLEVQGPYAILEEHWPEIRLEVEELLSQLNEMETFYEQPQKEPDDEVSSESIR